MRLPVRRRWTLLIATLCAFPALSAAPEWAAGTIEDMWDYPECQHLIKREADRRCVLQAESEFVVHRLNVKETILDEIEQGRFTLAEAANRFLAMDRDRPEVAAFLYPPGRVGSEDEIAAMSVIRHMRARREGGRPLVAGTLDRMVAAFESAYGYVPEDE